MFHSRNLNNKIKWIHERALRFVYQNSLSFSELLDLDNSVTVLKKKKIASPGHRNLKS